MQPEHQLSKNSFLKHHYCILAHHMNCILESRMMLDEDLNLLLTFWNPIPIKKKNDTYVYPTVACAISAASGIIAASKTNNMYLLIASLTPTVVQVSYRTRIFYNTRKYKRNCEKLISQLGELHELNCIILEYNRRTMISMPKISERGYDLLKTTKCEFVKFSLVMLMQILQNLISKMREISSLVPVTEGEYMYAAEWDLAHFVPDNLVEFSDMLHRFESLSDLSVLIISNFLGSVGLTLCLQLWKGNAVNFRKIFDVIIPNLCKSLDGSIRSIKSRFNQIRYTLAESEEYKKNQLQKRKRPNIAQLQRPLDEFLFDTQILFEVGKHLKSLLDKDQQTNNKKEVSIILDDINQQFAKCSESLDSVIRSLRIVTRRSRIPSDFEDVHDVSTFVTPVEIHHGDDSQPLLEDEEYSLSIHGSDAGDDVIAPVIDFAEQCSSENIEMMLIELKRKLDERKNKKDSELGGINIDNSAKGKDDGDVVLGSAPQPPPPPPIPCLPTSIDSSHRHFLEAVRSVAQNLNRTEEFQFGFNMFPEIPRPFNTTYQCYSVAMLPGNERQDVERGGKIIMPPSALEQLTRLNINYPMLFKIVNKKTNRTSHCGVLEFVADEGKVYLPLWLMHNLVLEESDLIQIESVSLPVGKFAKFQPLSPEFLDITNPKAVLENCLRTFACLTTGDVIAVRYNQKAYELCVLETQPGNAISIIECDMNVEFAAPIGYKEAEESKPNEEEMAVDPADLMPEPSGFVAFKGAGNRLDGKRRKDSASTDMPAQKPVYVRGIPDYDYQIGTLRFLRNLIKSPAVDKEDNPEFKVFSGKGFSLKRGI